MNMKYEKFITGPLQVNTYVVTHPNSGSCVIIDPSNGCGEVISYIRGESLQPCAVLLTHGHFDHIMGLTEIIDRFNDIPVYIHAADQSFLTDPVKNGSLLVLGENFSFTKPSSLLPEGTMNISTFTFDVIHLPGHTPGGCAFLFERYCFCGDAVFAGSIGRTDLPEGNYEQLISAIQKKILTLPPNTVLCPGHGGRTTVDREKRLNPFLQES
ncbi:MAG: MBL fold metallo-hydrolase [Chitinispirillales bacterium]|jgi:glyoxylase-like metal-dependent hydrolase (beta-lactamase superfamily II)|nr:MBL fold metallo-hydrolase [Chitinispirillales bacterium]